MKTVGEILRKQREKKKFSLEDVHKFLKIHPRFLNALETGDYAVFSGKVHSKGFLKMYAEFLELDVDQVLAFWRREYEAIFEKTQQETKKVFNLKALEPERFVLTPGLVLAVSITVLVIGFFGYLYYQYSSYSGAPRLDLFSPENNIVLNSEILDITGKTERDSELFINNQKVNLGTDGGFATSIRLNPGLNTMSIRAVNRLGKETEVVRTIIYRPVETAGKASIESEVAGDEDASEATESVENSSEAVQTDDQSSSETVNSEPFIDEAVEE